MTDPNPTLPCCPNPDPTRLRPTPTRTRTPTPTPTPALVSPNPNPDPCPTPTPSPTPNEVTALTEGGVTYYQTRAARETVRSPSNERTWLKKACHNAQHVGEHYLGEPYLGGQYLGGQYPYRRGSAGGDGEFLGGAGDAGGPRGLTLVQDGRNPSPSPSPSPNPNPNPIPNPNPNPNPLTLTLPCRAGQPRHARRPAALVPPVPPRRAAACRRGAGGWGRGRGTAEVRRAPGRTDSSRSRLP